VKLQLDERFNFRNILNSKAVRNAFAIDMAMGEAQMRYFICWPLPKRQE